MNTVKLVVGIISMVISAFILFQSCAAGVVNSIEGSGAISGTVGLLVAAFFIIAGIIGVATRHSTGKGGPLTAAGFYMAAALFGGTMAGNYLDLHYWALLTWGFGAVYIVDTFYEDLEPGEIVKWWHKSWLITLALIIFPPAGIALLWTSHKFKLAPKIITTVIFTIGFLIILGNFSGTLNSSGSATAGSSTASATTTGTDSSAQTAAQSAAVTRVYGPGETWTVDGQFSLTLASATLTDYRNQFSDLTPAQVVLLNYDYTNSGVAKNVMDLYISSNNFKVIDGSGVMASSYPAATTGNPQETPIGATCAGVQAAYGLTNASGEITVNVEVIGNNYKNYEAVFKLPVS